MGILNPADFKDTTLSKSTGIARAHVRFSKLFPRFKRAQIWLDNRIMLDMQPYIPFRTGAFQGRIQQANAGRAGTGGIVVYVPPQGRWLYNGVAYSKSGARPIHYTNPLTTPHWFETVSALYKNQWVRGVKDIIKGK